MGELSLRRRTGFNRNCFTVNVEDCYKRHRAARFVQRHFLA